MRGVILGKLSVRLQKRSIYHWRVQVLSDLVISEDRIALAVSLDISFNFLLWVTIRAALYPLLKWTIIFRTRTLNIWIGAAISLDRWVAVSCRDPYLLWDITYDFVLTLLSQDVAIICYRIIYSSLSLIGALKGSSAWQNEDSVIRRLELDIINAQ